MFGLAQSVGYLDTDGLECKLKYIKDYTCWQWSVLAIIRRLAPGACA